MIVLVCTVSLAAVLYPAENADLRSQFFLRLSAKSAGNPKHRRRDASLMMNFHPRKKKGPENACSSPFENELAIKRWSVGRQQITYSFYTVRRPHPQPLSRGEGRWCLLHTKSPERWCVMFAFAFKLPTYFFYTARRPRTSLW